ncbi:hypothetical protein HCB17_25080 [Salinispora arenicola]|uniref:hypothetical protein n=1 Tax=Salinispora arenicola TaxID=168697 RepID=UPI001430B5EE|nr:hypothetical protein [Salinispora arenicola]NIL44024.1 hypothetical protein [Salinispora arenicola]
MAFPADPLDVRVELDVGGWTDITSDVLTSHGPVVISRGRTSEGSEATPTQVSMSIRNTDGRYSPRNPTGPYYGVIGRNTPLRVRVGPAAQAASFLGLTPGENLSTPDHASLRIVGDLDVRFDCRADWFLGASMDLGGRYNTSGDNRSWAALVSSDGRLTITWSPDGTFGARRALSASVAVSPPSHGRLAVRITLDVDNGAGGVTARFYQGQGLAGPWTQLGGDVVDAGASSILAGTAALELGHVPGIVTGPLAGDLFAAQVRDGIDGLVVAAPDLNTVPDLTVDTFTDTAGRLWTAGPTVDLVDRSARAFAEVSSWPPRWDLSGTDVWVPVQGAGVLRRLTQGAAALRSPVYRTFISYTPAAYLPLEDGADATRPASAADGITHGTSQDIDFGVDAGAGFGGTAAAARMTTTTASISTPVRAGTDANGHWSVGMYMRLAQPSGGDQLVMRVRVAGGSVARYELSVTDGTYWWRAYDAADQVVGDRNVLYGTGADPTGWVAHALDVQSDPAGTRWAGVWHGVGDTNFWATVPGGETLPGLIGAVTSVELHGSAHTVDGLFAHLIVTPIELPFVRDSFRRVSTGYDGERAGERIRRLTAEAGVALEVVGDTSLTELCGPQRAAPLVELLEAAARVDGGILAESRSLLGLSYRTRRSLYNQTALPISYAGQISEPFEPVDDDRGLVNDVTVTRPGGSSARATATSGPLSTAAPPHGVGTYDRSIQLDVHDDGQLPDQAGWRLHLGTVDEARYPHTHLDLAAPGYDSDLTAAVAAVDAGDVLALSDLPSWLPPGPTAVMVQGTTEVLDTYQWDITVNATPASPWDVAVVDGPQRVGADGSTIAAVDASVMTLTMTSTAANRPWTTDPADFPMDLQLGGGERVTATGITGTGLTQTVALSARAVNGVSRAWPDGTEVQVWAPAVVPL